MHDLNTRYELKQKIGEGASAVVWLAEDTLTKQIVAIKKAHDVLAKHAKFAGRWQREVIVLSMLQHPRVVPLLDADLRKNKLSMVMANAEQGSLDHQLQVGCTLKKVLAWLLQTLEGLAHIHSFGVIHQDIKPDNILINGESSIWLADFSVARTRAELLINRQDVTGTPEWYAPEQRLRMASEIGPWTDLFAWGKILEHVMNSTSYRSLELITIVEGCIEPDPQQRFRSAAEIIPLLETVIQTLPANILHRKFQIQMIRTGSQHLHNSFSFSEDLVPKNRKGKPSIVDTLPPTSGINCISSTLLTVSPPPRQTSVLEDVLLAKAKAVQQSQMVKVVLLKGPSGSDKKEIIRNFTRKMYVTGMMDSVVLSYHQNGSFDDGYRDAVQHILSPWGDDRESFIVRVKRWIAREKQISVREAEREATGLAKWCGFLHSHEQSVDNGLGLVFLFQHLQHLAWKNGVVLVLENPEHCVTNGDGLDICESMLSDVFIHRPVLILAAISDQNIQNDTEIQRKIDILSKMGAEILQVDLPSSEEVLGHIEQYCMIPVSMREQVLHFCERRIDRANLFLQDVALSNALVWSGEDRKFALSSTYKILQGTEFFVHYFESVFVTIPQPENALEILAVMVCSPEPVEQLLLNQISSIGLQELLQVGLLSQKERSIRFAHPQMRLVVKQWIQDKLNLRDVQEHIALAWLELGERWGLRLDLQIGRAWLEARQPQKSLAFLLLAVQDAINSRLWKRVGEISLLVEEASKQSGSDVGLVEALLDRLEVYLKRHQLQQTEALFSQLSNLSGMDVQAQGRLAVLRAEWFIYQKQWTQAHQQLQVAYEKYSETQNNRGKANVFMRQGYLLFLLNKLEGAADRFAQVGLISPKTSLEWAESQARLIEIRLRLGWIEGLPNQIDHFWKVTQNNADVHHMAYATYAAGLLLINQGRLEEALIRLQTTQALAASCGDPDLQAQSLENQGSIYFLQSNWAEARQTQKQLVYHYQMRNRVDRRRVAMLRFRCACAFESSTPSIWVIDIPNVETTFVHVQFWWWVFQMLEPSNTAVQMKSHWNQAKQVSVPKIWDLALYRVLLYISQLPTSTGIREEIEQEMAERFSRTYTTLQRIGQRY